MYACIVLSKSLSSSTALPTLAVNACALKKNISLVSCHVRNTVNETTYINA